jgi:hypothetical protein
MLINGIKQDINRICSNQMMMFRMNRLDQQSPSTSFLNLLPPHHPLQQQQEQNK